MNKAHQKMYLEVIDSLATREECGGRKRAKYICNKTGGHKLIPWMLDEMSEIGMEFDAHDIADFVFVLYITDRTYKDYTKELRKTLREDKLKRLLGVN